MIQIMTDFSVGCGQYCPLSFQKQLLDLIDQMVLGYSQLADVATHITQNQALYCLIFQRSKCYQPWVDLFCPKAFKCLRSILLEARTIATYDTALFERPGGIKFRRIIKLGY